MDNTAASKAIGFRAETVFLALEELKSSKAWDLRLLNRLRPGLGDRVEAAETVGPTDRWRIHTATWNEVLGVLAEAGQKLPTSILGGDLRPGVLNAVLLRWQREFGELLTSPEPEARGELIASLLAELEGRTQAVRRPPVMGLMTDDQPIAERPKRPFSDHPTPLLFLFLFILVQAAAQWNDVREGICDINNRLVPTASISNIRKAIRTSLCGAPAASVRIVSRDNVNLRAGPSMKAEIILRLPKGHVLGVVDDSDRDWLNVYMEKDGYLIEGWVSRKYLKTVR